MNFSEALAYLTELEVFGMKPGLARVAALLSALEHPERKFKAVHVTGTNGKGSVSAMLANILSASGAKTGLFVSPHLITYCERIQINGSCISEADFAAAIAAVKSVADSLVAHGNESPTQFEVLTAAAFWHFAESRVDYAVIEVGLGGLYDSTNVLEPEIAIITNVTAEHEDKCGGTLTGVAKHKAGIIKPQTPLITAALGAPQEIILAKARDLNAPTFVLGRDFSVEVQEFSRQGQKILWRDKHYSATYVLTLLGRHQAQNAALAVKAAHILAKRQPHINAQSIAHGLATAKWPGRLELFAPPNAKTALMLDGAHNPAGMAALRQALDEYFPDEERLFVLGILRDKNIPAMLDTLLRPKDRVIVTRPVSPRAAEPRLLAREVGQICAVEVEEPPAEALRLALAKQPPLVIVCGSLYLIGAVRHEVIK